MIERNKLKFAFSLENFPIFTCPQCGRGELQPISPLNNHHPQYSADNYSQDWADTDVIELSCSGTVECSSASCTAQSTVHLVGSVLDYEGTDGSPGYEESYSIKSFYPSPQIISIPEYCPDEISSPLKSAFASFWFDRGLALNSLRNSFEALIGCFGVPETENGNWIPLGVRTKRLKTVHPDAAELIKLMTPHVNAGSHMNEVKLETILDCFEAFELFLSLHFDDKLARLEALKVKFQSASK